MTSIIKLEALSGVMDDGPLCYLLQVDEFHFLLDCGWDEKFDLAYLDVLKRRAPQIDAVLLSYPDIPHLGALPYLIGKCGLACPVYATVPVFKMGQMFLYDWFLSHNNVEEFVHFNLDDVDAAFDKVQQLKYSQQVSLKGRGHGLQITPVPAGHMIGGTIWRITKMGEEEIVYAVDFNHKKERHLNGCTFEGISRPNLFITDSKNALYQQARRKQRDEQLLTNVLKTLRNGGDVLLVIDTAGRVLELAHLLDQLWHNAEAGLITYNLVMLNNVAYNVVEFAKSQVEWMSDKILRAFEEGRYNPFQFRHVQLCHSTLEMNRVRSPKVVLASHPDMECGFSRELFLEWCADSKNSIILTDRSSASSLANKLIHMATGGPDVSRHLQLIIKRRIKLEGAELEAFWQKKKEKEQEAARIRLEQQRRSIRVETVESDDESDVEDMDMTAVSDHPYDIMYKFEQQQKASIFKQSKKSFPMFPFVEEKTKWDDYGEIIRPEDYMLADSVVPSAPSELKRENVEHPKEVEQTATEIPSKCISSRTNLEVLCHLAFIDFEGGSDGESMKKLLNQIRPKQLLIVHGSVEATSHLAKYCQEHSLVQGRIFTPRLGEIVDATIESHIFQVTLTDVLMSSLEFQPVKDAELAWIDSRIGVRQQVENPMLPKHEPEEKEEQIRRDSVFGETETNKITYCLESLPLTAIPSHSAVYVNDPKLSDLKQLLMQQGFQAEFSAGVLYVNNVLSVRRNEAGKFHLEGCASDDYYKIRDQIYRQFAIV